MNREELEEQYLPPKELWPEIIIPEEVPMPPKANLAYALLDRHVAAGKGDQVAVKDLGTCYTYREIQEGSLRIAHGLVNLGIRKGQRVSYMLNNTKEAIMVNFALQRIGAIVAPSSPYWDKESLRFILNNVGVSLCVVSSEYLSKIEAVKDEVPTLKWIMVVGDHKICRERGHICFDQMLDTEDSSYFLEEMDPEDIAAVLHTSGTTGKPKGCVHKIKSVISECYLVNKYVWRLVEGDVLGGSAPVCLAAGYGTFCLIPFWAGSTISLIPKFSPKNLIEAIERDGVTVLTGLTNTYKALLKHPGCTEESTRHLRLCTAGGSTLDPPVYRSWLERVGRPIYEGLGATEMLHLVLSNAVHMRPKAGSVGFPIPGFDVKIINEKNEPCPPGEMGRMIAKGPTGVIYWNAHRVPELLEKQKRNVVDGYTCLGDVMTKVPSGYYYFVARVKDLMHKEGKTIGPLEIEELLITHPYVEDAGVISLPKEENKEDEEIVAFVVTKWGDNLPMEKRREIRQFCKENLDAEYKVPDCIEGVAFIPRTPAGKPLRNILRKWEMGKRLERQRKAGYKSGSSGGCS